MKNPILNLDSCEFFMLKFTGKTGQIFGNRHNHRN